MARAMPKSITLTAPLGVSITLAGLMSRCTMPARWLYSRRVSSTPVVHRWHGRAPRPSGRRRWCPRRAPGAARWRGRCSMQDLAQGPALDVLHHDERHVLDRRRRRRSRRPRRCRRRRRSTGGSARRPTAPRGGTAPGRSGSRARSARSILIATCAPEAGVAAQRARRPSRRGRAAPRSRSGAEHRRAGRSLVVSIPRRLPVAPLAARCTPLAPCPPAANVPSATAVTWFLGASVIRRPAPRPPPGPSSSRSPSARPSARDPT